MLCYSASKIEGGLSKNTSLQILLLFFGLINHNIQHIRLLHYLQGVFTPLDLELFYLLITFLSLEPFLSSYPLEFFLLEKNLFEQ